jgi:hypothetical protein
MTPVPLGALVVHRVGARADVALVVVAGYGATVRRDHRGGGGVAEVFLAVGAVEEMSPVWTTRSGRVAATWASTAVQLSSA